MAAIAVTEPGLELKLSLPLGWQGTKRWAIFCCLLGAPTERSEAKQLGFKPTLVQDASIAGDGCTTTPTLSHHLFFSDCFIFIVITWLIRLGRMQV